jgi:uncharacterized membrane protein YdbT with pleckstrin-like domain
LDNERQRLERLCQDRHIDTRTRKQKDRDKEREQAADDTSRNTSRQREATCPNRQRAAIKNDTNLRRKIVFDLFAASYRHLHGYLVTSHLPYAYAICRMSVLSDVCAFVFGLLP